MAERPLFPEPTNPDPRPRGWHEPISDYLARSTMPVAVELREWLRRNVALAPVDAQADLRGRLAGNDEQFRSAEWELACARVLGELGYQLDWHPALPNENPKHPDFLARRDGMDLFYFEARVIEDERDSEEARVLDELNKVTSPDYWLSVKLLDRGEQSAATRKLRDFVHRALEGASWPAAVQASVWESDGWRVEIGFRPKGAASRGNPLDRPVGMHSAHITVCTVAEQLRRQVKKKISKYGRLELPLVIGVRIVDLAHDEHEILNALLGTAVYSFQPHTNEGRWGRHPDGLLVRPSGPQSRRLSALLVASRLNVVAPEASRVKVWFHPEPYCALDPTLLPFDRTTWRATSGEKIDETGSADWDELLRRESGTE